MKYLLAAAFDFTLLSIGEIRSTLGKCRKFKPENIFTDLLIVHIIVHNILSVSRHERVCLIRLL